MKNIWATLVILASTFVSFGVLFFGPSISLADEYVDGYFRSNGTYVNGYWRSSPDGDPYNNYSYPGNYNPYTGVTASGNADTYLRDYYSNDYFNYTPSYDYIPSYDTSSSYYDYTPSYDYSGSYDNSYDLSSYDPYSGYDLYGDSTY